MRRAVIAIVALAACGSGEATPTSSAPAMPAQPIDAVVNRTAYLPAQCYAPTQVGARTSNSCATCHRASHEPNYVDDADVQTVLSIPRAAAQNPWTNIVHPPAPAAVEDPALLAYVRADNTAGADLHGCALNPDADGWDRDARGAKTGWRAYRYAPVPGMFWPTNGSFGDAYIRVPDGTAAPGLFPAGTEILHTLRYLDVVDGQVQPARRVKEIRYMKKLRYLTYAQLDIAAKAELREKEQNPDTTKKLLGDGDRGVATGTGWILQAQIERPDGTLRRQTLEETGACIGCHGGVGATTDSTFSFARKTGWGAQDVRGMPEPVRSDGRGEYRAWLEATGAGDDYRANAEVAALLDDAGHLAPLRAIQASLDISTLILPSPGRALALDRAYLAIVRAQSFAKGRDAIVGTPHVQTALVQDAATGIKEPVRP